MNGNFVVTGAAQGIGLAMSREVLSAGGKVFMTDINTKFGEESQSKLAEEFGADRVEFATHDVSDKDGWIDVWDKAELFFNGKVQALCNNAGIYHKTDWERVLNINMMGSAYGIMIAMERMGVSRGGEGGLIVQTGSLASLLAGFPTIEEGAYTASKHAMQGYVRTVANQQTYLKEKVRLVGLCPSFVNTALVQAQGHSSQDIKDKFHMDVMEINEVANAFTRLVIVGEPGQMLTVLPGYSFFWPDIGMHLMMVCSLACKFYIKVLGHSSKEPITPQQIGKAVLMLFILAAIVLHLILSWLGF